MTRGQASRWAQRAEPRGSCTRGRPGEKAACFPAPHRIHEGAGHCGACKARRHLSRTSPSKKDDDAIGDEPHVHATEPPCHKAELWNERATCGRVDPVRLKQMENLDRESGQVERLLGHRRQPSIRATCIRKLRNSRANWLFLRGVYCDVACCKKTFNNNRKPLWVFLKVAY